MNKKIVLVPRLTMLNTYLFHGTYDGWGLIILTLHIFASKIELSKRIGLNGKVGLVKEVTILGHL